MARRGDWNFSTNTKLLGAVSFLNDASSEMLEPIIPLFMANVLGASAFAIGLLEGISEIVVAIMRFLSGWISDAYRSRKKLVLFGYSLSTVMKAFFPLSSSWQQFFVLKSVERVGKGIRTPPRDAMIGESEPASRLGKAFGFRKMMDSTGAIVGPLLAAILLAFFSGMGEEGTYRAIFAIAVVPAFLGVLLVLPLKENERTLERIRDGKKLFNGELRGFMLVAALFSIGQVGIAFFILRSNELLPLVMVPVAYLAYNITYAAMAIPMGVLTERAGPKKMMVVAYCLFAVTSLVFAFFSSPLAAFAGFTLLGLFIAITETTPRVYIVETVPGHRYASAIGAYQGVTGILLLPANIIAGLLWDMQLFGAHAPFVLSALAAGTSAILMWAWVRDARRWKAPKAP